jgi:hypothetical protein
MLKKRDFKNLMTNPNTRPSVLPITDDFSKRKVNLKQTYCRKELQKEMKHKIWAAPKPPIPDAD